MGLIDEHEVYLNPLVRMQLADVKRFDSGVVLLTYSPAS